MSDLGELLTSTNAFIIYIGIATVIVVYTMIYLEIQQCEGKSNIQILQDYYLVGKKSGLTQRT